MRFRNNELREWEQARTPVGNFEHIRRRLDFNISFHQCVQILSASELVIFWVIPREQHVLPRPKATKLSFWSQKKRNVMSETYAKVIFRFNKKICSNYIFIFSFETIFRQEI